MKIHLAVDLAALGPALELAEAVSAYVESMWIGPALLKNERLRAAEAFKISFPDMPWWRICGALNSPAWRRSLPTVPGRMP